MDVTGRDRKRKVGGTAGASKPGVRSPGASWVVARDELDLIATEVEAIGHAIREDPRAGAEQFERCANAAHALGAVALEAVFQGTAHNLRALPGIASRGGGMREPLAALRIVLLAWLRDPSPRAARSLARQLGRPCWPHALSPAAQISLQSALGGVRLMRSRRLARLRAYPEGETLAVAANEDQAFADLLREEFLENTRALRRAVGKLLAADADADAAAHAMRVAHTLKATADAAGSRAVSGLAHRIEDLLVRADVRGDSIRGPSAAALARMAERLASAAEGFCATMAAVAARGPGAGRARGSSGEPAPGAGRSAASSRVIDAFRARLDRTVRDACRASGKLASLVVDQRCAALDERLLSALVEPLTQLLRNAVDHGIEPPRQRERSGKTAAGRIEVGFLRRGGRLHVRCVDDGAGLDFEAIRAAAAARGLIRGSARPGSAALARLLVAPGFTTLSSVGARSGRGSGLDIAAQFAARLGGSLRISPGKGAVGTRVTISVPQAGEHLPGEAPATLPATRESRDFP